MIRDIDEACGFCTHGVIHAGTLNVTDCQHCGGTGTRTPDTCYPPPMTKPSSVPQEPCRPTDAYYAVATHLHDSYFQSPIPPQGIYLIVNCKDGSTSHWHMSVEMAGRVCTALATDPQVVSCGTAVYEGMKT